MFFFVCGNFCRRCVSFCSHPSWRRWWNSAVSFLLFEVFGRWFHRAFSRCWQQLKADSCFFFWPPLMKEPASSLTHTDVMGHCVFLFVKEKRIVCPQFGRIYRTRGFFQSTWKEAIFQMDGSTKQPSNVLRSEVWALWRLVVAFHYSLARFGGHSIIDDPGFCRRMVGASFRANTNEWWICVT